MLVRCVLLLVTWRTIRVIKTIPQRENVFPQRDLNIIWKLSQEAEVIESIHLKRRLREVLKSS